MSLNRGLLVHYAFPQAPDKQHPAIVISNKQVEEKEGFCIIAMISNTSIRDQYTFDLDCDMFKNTEKAPTGQVRMHIIFTVLASSLRFDYPLVIMKSAVVDSLVEQISSTTFSA
jgi:mRNA-degrading endonuclease toxin of MazEF toxin-antitoxin module